LKTMPSFGYRHTIIIVHRSPLSFRGVVGCTQQSTRGVYRSNKHVMHCLGFLVQRGHAAGHPWFITCSVKPTTRRRDNYRTPSINRSVSPPWILSRTKKNSCNRRVAKAQTIFYNPHSIEALLDFGTRFATTVAKLYTILKKTLMKLYTI
jgi:hypothetical protein